MIFSKIFHFPIKIIERSSLTNLNCIHVLTEIIVAYSTNYVCVTLWHRTWPWWPWIWRGYRAGRGYGRGGPGRGGHGRGEKDNERTALDEVNKDDKTRKPDDAKSKDPPYPKGGNAGGHFV